MLYTISKALQLHTEWEWRSIMQEKRNTFLNEDWQSVITSKTARRGTYTIPWVLEPCAWFIINAQAQITKVWVYDHSFFNDRTKKTTLRRSETSSPLNACISSPTQLSLFSSERHLLHSLVTNFPHLRTFWSEQISAIPFRKLVKVNGETFIWTQNKNSVSRSSKQRRWRINWHIRWAQPRKE